MFLVDPQRGPTARRALAGAAATLVCGLLLLAGAARAQAVDATASRITRVTVYAGSATVERSARVVTGARQLVFTCLPATLDAQSLQVAADPGVRVGELRVLTEDRDATAACASPLDGRIREIEDQIAALKAEADAHKLVDGYLKSVAAGGAPAAEPGAGRAAAPTPAQLGALADALRKSAGESLARQHQLARRQQDLERTLKPLLAERERTAGQRQRVVSVAMNLAAERDAELRLGYQVRGPSWQPAYRATLDTARSALVLERQALVAQSTGEDWGQVQLTLSTGQPGRATQGRGPRPWVLDVAPPRPALAERPAAPVMAAPPPAPAPAARAVANDDALPVFDVSTIDKGHATEFAVPQRISVPSSGQRIALTLGSSQAAAQLFTRTAPAAEEAAYLVAEFAPPAGVWPAGSVALYRDGAYVGAGRLDLAAATSAGGASSLWFGRDERVVVRAEPPQSNTASAGLTGGTVERRVGRAYVVENRHTAPVTLQVLEAAPVSRNEKIEVISRYQPQPASLAWLRDPGTIAWQQGLAPGASARFVAEHVLRYPRDIELQERQ